MSAALTTRIPIRDRDGRVIDQKEVVLYAGLLARAHDEGLRRVDTVLIQAPSEANGGVAICRSVVETDRGVFSGIGDASADNVNRIIAPHLIRMAATRAKARALRDAVNIGIVALEELGGDESPVSSAPAPDNVRQLPRRRDTSDDMTRAQRRYLFRLAAERGVEGDAATAEVCAALGVASIDQVTKADASSLIDQWKEAAGA